jgi:molecular chaperone DnaJ
MGESYYDLLGVSDDATTDEIEQAYREKLKETHPDVSDSDDASERTRKLLDAKETLTDESERDRYDRLGHDAYVDTDQSNPSTTSSAQRAAEHVRQTSASTSHGNGTTGRHRQTGSSPGPNRRGRKRHSTTSDTKRASQQETTYTENVGDGANWASTSGGDKGSGTRETDRWRAWSSDRAYAVERGTDVFRLGNLFKQQHVMVMLGATFLVYPVLLFGALSTQFPLGINLFVAACIIFVIAFLQSIPEVGIVVFAAWTVLLPPILLFGPGPEPFSLQSIMAMTAVVFPLGLSALTRVAIRPVTAS